jgi:hypothetical protein
LVVVLLAAFELNCRKFKQSRENHGQHQTCITAHRRPLPCVRGLLHRFRYSERRDALKIDQNITQHQTAANQTYRFVEWKQPVAVALIAMLIVFARMPDRVIYGFLWGEDGKVFLEQAYGLGFDSIFTPYAGYLHILPRVIALGFSKIAMIDQAPRPFMWVSAFVLCSTCAYLFTFARKTMPLPAAWAFGLAPILIPASGEVWLTITNLQWVIAPALLVLLWDEFCSPAAEVSRASGDIVRGTAIVLMTLTGPFGLMFSPVIVFGLIVTRNVSRSRRARVAIGAYFVAVGMQLITIVFNHPPIHASDGGIRHGAFEYLNYPWGAQFLRHLIMDFSIQAGWAEKIGPHWLIVANSCFASLAVCCLLAGRRCRSACVALAVLALALWMVGVIRSGSPDTTPIWSGYGGRYFYVPFILLAWALIVSIAATPYFAIRFIAGFLLAAVLLNSISQFSAPVWAHSGVMYREETHKWQLIVPPSPEWFVDLKPAQIGK